MRPGVTIPSATTKVKTKDKGGIKGVKTKKVPKGDLKGQMKLLKSKQMAAKAKAAKNIVKVKAVKKK